MRIGLLLFPDLTQLDLTGPYEVFAAVPGATVHLVDEEYDRGAIVLQERVAIAHGETSESLAAKVLAVEHALYPRVIGLFAEGRVRVEDHQVIIA